MKYALPPLRIQPPVRPIAGFDELAGSFAVIVRHQSWCAANGVSAQVRSSWSRASLSSGGVAGDTARKAIAAMRPPKSGQEIPDSSMVGAFF